MDLFDFPAGPTHTGMAPLAYRMRPENLDQIVGQDHMIGPGAPLRQALEKDKIHSFVLYGPPGTGKTSLAQIIARLTSSRFIPLRAVSAGVSEIRKIAADALEYQKLYRQKTILFVDEIHRFNKSQQDVLLPFVEDGTLTLIGATTENPLYELNNALLSRLKIYVLEALNENAIRTIINRALRDPEKGLALMEIEIAEPAWPVILQEAKGDARIALNMIDALANSYKKEGSPLVINLDLLKNVTGKRYLPYDRQEAYDAISAFIKSIRGSDPDAAIFWLAVMLEGGEDPKYIARRLIVHAAEDIGLADPHALVLAVANAYAVDFTGMPEGRITLAETAIYLSTAPKSNSCITAIDKAIATVREQKRIAVPPHLKDNSHSNTIKTGYKYPHDYGGYIEQEYLPPPVKNKIFYHPGDNKSESQMKLFLDELYPGKQR